MLNALRPIIKVLLDEETDRNDTRTNFSYIHTSDDEGNQRLLTPAGNGTWDRWIKVHVSFLRGDETDQELRTLADRVPLTYIERMGPHLTRNRTYIFIVERFGCKFMRSRHRAMGNMIRDRFWFFAASMGLQQLTAHMQYCISNVFIKRAEGIQAACEARHVEPYKDFARLIAFFQNVGERLRLISRKTFERVRSRQSARAPAPVHPTPIAYAAAQEILALARGVLPRIYEPVRSFIAMEYPALTRLSLVPGGPGYAAA